MRKYRITGLVVILLGMMLAVLLGVNGVLAQGGQPLPAAPGGQEHAAQAGRLVEERQAAYASQFDELNQRIKAAEALTANLAAQEQHLAQQLAELQQVRGARTAVYQTQLEAIQAEYAARFAQYAAQLQETQARLAAANAQLGR